MMEVTAQPLFAARSQLGPRLGAFFLSLALLLTCITSVPQAIAAERSLPDNHHALFSRLTVEDGLSHASIRRVMQDSNGFIWIGTQQGLNRFDGNNVVTFNHYPDDPTSLSNGWIYDIIEDDAGQIWIATDSGLNLYQHRTATFEHFKHDPASDSSLLDDSVRALFQARDGSLWIGTRLGLSRWEGDGSFSHHIRFSEEDSRNGSKAINVIAEDADGFLWIAAQTAGLLRFDPASLEILSVLAPESEVLAEKRLNIRTILLAHDGTIWAGTVASGVIRIDDRGEFDWIEHDPENTSSLSSNRIRRIFQDRQDRIWVATSRGLNLWLPETRSFHHYRHNSSDPKSLGDDVVTDITQDQGGVIWLGTVNGVSKWNPQIRTFAHIRGQAGQTLSLSNNRVTSFAENSDRKIWIGTVRGGLNLWDAANNSFQHFDPENRDGEKLSDTVITALMTDDAGGLWAGTMNQGITYLDQVTGLFSHYKFDRADSSSLSGNGVANIAQDKKGRIWIATYGGGLNLYLGNGRFRQYPDPDNYLEDFPSYFLVDIEQGRNGKLWLASDGGGVILFDPETEKVEAIQHIPDVANSISGNHIICLLETDDSLWVGTRDTGLNQLKDGRWRHFNIHDGLPSNAIYGLLEDQSGNIWVSHSKGLSKYNTAEDTFTGYDAIHGLQGKDFNNGAYLLASDGKMLFGGSNGFNAFYPQDVITNTHVPPVQLTKFSKFNREFQLDQPPYEVEAIDLRYDDYVVGFEFSALDYTDPSKNQYRYMLAGFDREWVSANGIRQATYTNLGPGDYTFRVQGSNNDGLWNEEGLSIAVKVDPAPWATWWAMALYTMVAIGVVYGTAQAYSVRLHREEQRRYNEQLEALVAERTAALESEITGHKTAQQELSRSLREKEVLLKEVHHRVKNNMQVISSLLNIQADSIMDQRFQTLLTESQQRIKSMALIHENLYRSDSLLEINFHDYIEMLTNGLVRFYRFERLAITLELDVENIFLDIDTAVPCGLIINELVSNSLKHGYHGREGEGQICVRFKLNEDSQRYEFSVRDDGNGIDENVDLETSGSMGLEIVRILTEQLDGSWRHSGNGGTEFTIDFPRKK